MKPLLNRYVLAGLLALTLAACSPNQSPSEQTPNDPNGKTNDFPDISGYWQDLEADFLAVHCNEEAFKLVVSLMLEKPVAEGKVSGLLTLEDSTGFAISGDLSGSISNDGKLSGSASLKIDQATSPLTVNLKLTDKKLSGQLNFVNPSTCSDKKTSTKLLVKLNLNLIVNDNYEPNNNPQTATALELDFCDSLILNPTDADWFSFSLTKAAAITLKIDTFAKGSLFMDLHRNNQFEQIYTFDASNKEQTLDLIPGDYSFVLYAEPLVRDYMLTIIHNAYPDDPLEPNDSTDRASKLEPNSSRLVYLAPGDPDWFSLSLTQAQIIKLELSGERTNDINLALFDENQKQVFSNYYGEVLDLVLNAGSYFLLLEGNHNLATLDLSSQPFDDQDSEPNDTKDQATPIDPNFSGSFFIYPEDEDWFRFDLPSLSSVLINKEFDVTTNLYNSAGELVVTDSFYAPLELEPGSYYLQFLVSGYTRTYTFSLQTTLLTDGYEPNDERSKATTIPTNFTGALVVHPKDQDWFRFSLNKSSFLDINLTNSGAYSTIHLSDENGKQLYQLSLNTLNRYALAAGTYFLELKNETAVDAINLTLSSSPVPDDAIEPNDQPLNATPLDLSQAYAGTAFFSINDRDCYRFEAPSESLIFLYSQISTNQTLYDKNFLAFSPQKMTGTSNDLMAVLAKGSYHLCLEPSEVIPQAGKSFTLRITLQDYADDSYEPNDSIATASTISTNFSAQNLFLKEGPNSQDSFNDDWYSFKLSERSLVSIKFAQVTDFYSRDSFSLNLLSADATTNLKFSAELEQILPAGTYYLKVGGSHRFEHWEFGAKYKLSLTSSAF